MDERMFKAVHAGDFHLAKELRDNRQTCRVRLEEVTARLLRNASVSVPKWAAHTKADAESGDIECAECGNNVNAHESRCQYCRWTYSEI